MIRALVAAVVAVLACDALPDLLGIVAGVALSGVSLVVLGHAAEGGAR